MAAQKHSCDGCYYYRGRWDFSKSCEYYLVTGKRRPPMENGKCSVKLSEKHSGKQAMTIKK